MDHNTLACQHAGTSCTPITLTGPPTSLVVSSISESGWCRAPNRSTLSAASGTTPATEKQLRSESGFCNGRGSLDLICRSFTSNYRSHLTLKIPISLGISPILLISHIYGSLPKPIPSNVFHRAENRPKHNRPNREKSLSMTSHARIL